jgi:hypothetical protein
VWLVGVMSCCERRGGEEEGQKKSEKKMREKETEHFALNLRGERREGRLPGV